MGIDEPKLNKVGHASFCVRCLLGLPGSMVEADSARLAVGFYSLGSLDILGLLQTKTKEADRKSWTEWLWAQQVVRRISGNDAPEEADLVGGFRPGPFCGTSAHESEDLVELLGIDPPHLIMTYTALLSLAILRDDFKRLNRKGLIGLLRKTQTSEGSFTAIPGHGEADIRMVYTAFAISSMLGDWSGIDVEKAIAFVKNCITYEGGFGQAPGNEATGGPTYCALASLYLAPPQYSHLTQLSPGERRRLVRWLVDNQVRDGIGGFRGRTEKDADACYSFWCGASLYILGEGKLVNEIGNAAFLTQCQFRPGGIAKWPEEHPDPYHTYLSLASLALYPPGDDAHESWRLPRLDPLINATVETAKWAREHISIATTTTSR